MAKGNPQPQAIKSTHNVISSHLTTLISSKTKRDRRRGRDNGQSLHIISILNVPLPCQNPQTLFRSNPFKKTTKVSLCDRYLTSQTWLRHWLIPFAAKRPDLLAMAARRRHCVCQGSSQASFGPRRPRPHCLEQGWPNG